jgi:hypothetical protein
MRRTFCALLCAIAAGLVDAETCRPALAQEATVPLPTLELTGDGTQSGPAASMASSQRVVSGDRINDLPFSRPGEVLEEAVPGLIVTQHSGEGKAN